MTAVVAAKFYTTQQKNGFLALNNAAATSLGLKYEVKLLDWSLVFKCDIM